MDEIEQSANSDRFAVMRVGMYLCGLATICAGILDLIWGDFDAGHQPIGALGVSIPDRALFAYITGAWMILSGAAIFWRQTVRMGVSAMAIIYFIFGCSRCHGSTQCLTGLAFTSRSSLVCSQSYSSSSLW